MPSDGQGETRKRHPLRTFLSVIVTIALVFVLAFALRTFVFQAYEVPSGSMEETIVPGDMVFSEKVSYYFTTPSKGDIVTFDDPENPGRILIKRVIAVGGQTVDLIDGSVYVDGVELDEPYTNGLPSLPLNSAFRAEITYPYTVPEGELWVMGDNRTNSSDSRYFGSIDASTVTGKAFLIYWPLNDLKLLT